MQMQAKNEHHFEQRMSIMPSVRHLFSAGLTRGNDLLGYREMKFFQDSCFKDLTDYCDAHVTANKLCRCSQPYNYECPKWQWSQ